METKKLIQIVVIAGCFIGSGVVIYNGLSGNKAKKITFTISQNVPEINIEKLLPFGEKLDLTGVLDRKIQENQTLQYGILDIPKVSTSSEIGIPMEQLIKPEPQSTVKK